jgi:hypothetical protein
LAEFGRSIVAEMFKQLMPIIQNQPKQIEFKQDYYTIKGYASKNKATKKSLIPTLEEISTYIRQPK